MIFFLTLLLSVFYSIAPAPAAGDSARAATLMPLGPTYFVSADAGRPAREILQPVLEEMRGARWSQARAQLNRVLRDHPDDLEALYLRGICSRQEFARFPARDRWNGAVQDFEAVLKRDAAYRDVLYQFALLFRADEQFHRAIELGHQQYALRPDLWHAQHGLFLLYRAYTGAERQERALAWLADHSSAEATFYRAEILRKAGKLSEAETLLHELLKEAPLSIPAPALNFSLAKIHYEREEPAHGQPMVEAAIEAVDSRLTAEFVMDEMKYLLTTEELEQYRDLQVPAGYVAFFRGMWARRNPLPAVQPDVRMTEHFMRVLYAEKNYAFTGLPPWETIPRATGRLQYPAVFDLNDSFSDMGLIYIRHGKPADLDLIGQGSVQFWRYVDPPMYFYFEWKSSGSFPSWQLVPGPPLDPMYGYAYKYVRELVTRANQGRDPSNQLDYRSIISSNDEREADQVGRFMMSYGLATDHHTWPEEMIPLDLPHMMATFRGDDRRSDVALYYIVPVGQVSRRAGAGADSILVSVGAALHDAQWHHLGLQMHAHHLPRNTNPAAAYVDAFHLNVPPGTYHLALSIQPDETHQMGGFKWQAEIPDYAGPALSMSDVLPAHEIQPLADPPESRNDLRIRVNAAREFSISEPLFLYFEPYNLTLDDQNRTRYSIEYTLAATSPGSFVRRVLRRTPGTVLTLKTEQSGTESDPMEVAEIDVTRVPRGEYTLTVRVTDELTGTTVERAMPVSLVR